MKSPKLILIVFILFFVACSCNNGDPYVDQRNFMVANQLKGRDITDPNVLEAMAEVKREAFVPWAIRNKAYYDHALPIGGGQTISQPYIVAFMTQALKLKPGDKVLEIGTGSGYHAAVMAEIAKEVYSIEIVESLAKSADKRLKNLGYENIFVKAGDGYVGWPENAPFDKIILTASPPKIPQPLIDQLKEGGVLVSPIDEGDTQILMRGKKENGKLIMKKLLDVRFVPMVGKVRE